MYRLTESGVLKIDENMYIPNEPLNRDWQEYQAWLSEGNTPEPIPGPTEEEVMQYNINKRDTMLTSTDWIVTRHRDQTDGELPTAYSDQQYKIVLQWRQSLRDMDFTIQEDPAVPDQETDNAVNQPPPSADKPTSDTPLDDSNQDDAVISPDQSVIEHAQMVKMALDNQPTLYVIWPPMPDFMQGMFDDYPPNALTRSTQMGI